MKQDLLTDVRTFLAQHGLSASRFGVLAVNDKNFVRDLEAGRRMWPETEAKVRDFMQAHAPEVRAA